MELPRKRECEYSDSGEEEVEASKKAKTKEEKAGSDDKMMLDSFADEDEGTDSSEEEEEEEEDLQSKKAKMEEEACLYIEMMSDSLSFAEKVDIVKEYQLFCQLTGDPHRAKKISSHKDARELFSNDEMNMFLEKTWHIRPNPSNLSDYELLAIYPSEHHPFYYRYAPDYRTYEFDRNYQKFTEELNQKIQWGTTRSDARATAKEIWKRYLQVDDDDTGILDESVNGAICLSHARQNMKELIPLFVELYKREMNGEDIVQALKLIVEEKGLGCYPRNKVLIEEALKNEKRRGISLRSIYDYMKIWIHDKTVEASVEDNRLNDLVTSYFEMPLRWSGDNYIDYVKEKIMVAKELKIIDK